MTYREGPMPSPYLVTAFGRFVVVVEAATGRELWRQQTNQLMGGTTLRLHVSEDEVVVLAGDTLRSFRLASGEPVRAVALGNAGHDTLLVVARRAYVSASGELSCIDLDGGKVVWRNELPRTGFGTPSIGVPGAVSQGDRA